MRFAVEMHNPYAVLLREQRLGNLKFGSGRQRAISATVQNQVWLVWRKHVFTPAAS